MSTIWLQLTSSCSIDRINTQFCRSAESNAHNDSVVHIKYDCMGEPKFMLVCDVLQFAKVRGGDICGEERGDDEFNKRCELEGNTTAQ